MSSQRPNHVLVGEYKPLLDNFRPTGGRRADTDIEGRQRAPSVTVALKPIEDDDHPWLVELHNDPIVLRNLTNPIAITLETHMNWWDTVKNNPRQLRFIYTVDGTRAGLTKFYDIDMNNGSCMLGADLHADFRNKSLAKPMWKLMLDMCFESMRLHRVSLTTAQFNIPAQRVYSGLGFKEEGRQIQSLFRDGQYYDQIMMYMLRSDWRTSVNP